jgi:DNA-directed RNA polymerase subunit RPC12/RpoP
LFPTDILGFDFGKDYHLHNLFEFMVSEVECPNCGAELLYDATKQGMKCEYCGTELDIETEEEAIKEKDLFKAPKEKGWDAQITKSKCSGCGATISSTNKITGECPFCGSKYVKDDSEMSRVIRPESIIPFKIDKKKAEKLFDNWIGKGWFRPGDLKKLKKLDNIKGVYIPFWTYDCRTDSSWTADAGYYYYETQTYTTRENGRTVTRTRQVRKTRWVPASGKRRDSYDDVLIVASKGLKKKLVEKVYPYRLSDLLPYKPEYIAGWMAEEYSIDVQEGWITAKSKVRAQEYKKCGRAVPGDTYRNLNVHTHFSDMTYKHVLLPLWSAAYTYKKKLFNFMINGQTGKIKGEKPLSWIKIAIAVALAVIVIGTGIFIYSQFG